MQRGRIPSQVRKLLDKNPKSDYFPGVMCLGEQESREKECLGILARQEKQFNGLYRAITDSFALPDCAMWVLYFLVAEGKPLSQQELAELMMFPKQTINSAVKSLQKKGMVELSAIPGSRNRKQVMLTPEGEHLAQQTVARLRAAELLAVSRFGVERMLQYLKMQQEFTTLVETAAQTILEN